MPPLLLDDDEAVAVAIGLRTATQGAVTGIEETSLRALAKLEQVLPPRLRRQVSTLQGVTRAGPARAAGPDRGPGDADRDRPPRARPLHAPLRLLGPARRRPRSGGSSRTGSSTPASAGTSSRGTSTGRTGGRSASTACAQGMSPGPRFTPRAADRRGGRGPRRARRPAARRASTRPGSSSRRRRRELVERWGPMLGTVTPIDETSCTIHAGADTVEQLAAWLGMLGVDFRVTSRRSSSRPCGRCPARYAAAARPERNHRVSIPSSVGMHGSLRLAPKRSGSSRSVEHSGLLDAGLGTAFAARRRRESQHRESTGMLMRWIGGHSTTASCRRDGSPSDAGRARLAATR